MMRTNRRVMGTIGLLALAIINAGAQKSSTGWTDYLGGPDSSHYSPLKQITAANVSQLEVAWTFPAGDGNYTFSPLVVDNVAYVAANGGSLVALDATTGKQIWSHTFDRGGVKASIGGQRGLNYWESKDRSQRRLFVTTSGFLYSIDALSGKEVDSFADHGRLDLKTGIDRTPVSLGSRTPGRTFGNLIILGSFPGEGYLAPPGDIRAFDLHTGKLAWIFHTIPRPGELGYDTWPKDGYKYLGGVDVWGEFTVDEKRGIVYFPVSSTKYELYGGDRHGNNVYADSLLALDARTGKYLWHFQTVHHDIWGFRPQPGAATCDGSPRRQGGGHCCAWVEERLSVRLRPRDGKAAVADRGEAGASDRPARRADIPDAALSHRSAAIRTAGHERGRPLHRVYDARGSYVVEGTAVEGEAWLVHTAQRQVRDHSDPQRHGRRCILRQRSRCGEGHGLHRDAQPALHPEDGSLRRVDFSERRRSDSQPAEPSAAACCGWPSGHG